MNPGETDDEVWTGVKKFRIVALYQCVKPWHSSTKGLVTKKTAHADIQWNVLWAYTQGEQQDDLPSSVTNP
jgi:hypothetical protein